MKASFTQYLLIGCVLLGLSATSFAQLPQVQEQSGITFITGGIGEDEAKAIKDEAKNWPLSVDFSQQLEGHDAWVSQVDLTIRDAKGGAIFETSLDGPMFLAKLPSGNYEIVMTYEGVTKRQKIQVIAGRPLHVSVSWRLSKSRG